MRLSKSSKRLLALCVWSLTSLPLPLPALQGSATGGLPLLTEAQQLRRLSPDEAARKYPVRLRGIVTFYHAPSGYLFIQDHTAGIYAHAPAPDPAIRQGVSVEVRGESQQGNFTPFVSSPRVGILGRATLPEAKWVPLAQIRSGIEDGQWVEVRGVVRLAAVEEGRWVLQIAGRSGRLRASIWEHPETDPGRLVDSEVRIRGVCASMVNDKGLVSGVQLLVQSADRVDIDVPGHEDPFALPGRSLNQFHQYILSGSGHRVKVRGSVTFQRLGRCLFLQDDSGSLYVTTAQETPVEAGDIVEAVGFPELGDSVPLIQDAVFRKVAEGKPPLPSRVNPARVLSGQYDTQFIQIDARLVDRMHLWQEQVLVMQAGYLTFNAHLEDARDDGTISALPLGSLLRLEGICSVQVDESKTPRTFRVLLRTPQDVEVLERPSWWTVERIITVVSLLVLVVLLSLAWVLALGRQIQKQTVLIREQLQRESDLERKLRQSQKMEAIGRLAGGIAHDFNNLLTVVIGNTHFLKDGLLPADPMHEGLEAIRKAGERAATLTHQLLAFSRQQVLSPKLFNLNSLLEEMSDQLAQAVGERVRLRTVMAPDLFPVRADPSQIRQVIMNLSVNARDAMPEGGDLILETSNVTLGPIWTSDHPEVVPGEYVMVIVSDTGHGMDDATRSRIFEPFFTTKEVGKGTGLGLATVYGIVKQSGGYIYAHSQPGEGTSFKIYFPRSTAEQREGASPSFWRGPFEKHERILVVENDPALRKLISGTLEREGYAVHSETNLTEALHAAEKSLGAFHAALIDADSAGEADSDRLTAKLRALHDGIGIILISSTASLHESSLDGRHCDPELIQKPFTIETLRKKVRESLDRATAVRPKLTPTLPFP